MSDKICVDCGSKNAVYIKEWQRYCRECAHK